MIRTDMIVVAGVALIVGYKIGRTVEAKGTARRLLTQRVLNVGDVAGSLTQDQAAVVQDLLDSGAEVLQERLTDLTLLLVRAGGDSAKRLFAIPTEEGLTRLDAYDRAVSGPQSETLVD